MNLSLKSLVSQLLAGNSLGDVFVLLPSAPTPQQVGVNSAGPFSENQPSLEPVPTNRSPASRQPDPLQKLFATRWILQQPWARFLLFQYAATWVIRQTLEKVYIDKSAITDQLVEEIYRPSCDPGAAGVRQCLALPRAKKLTFC